MRLNYGPRLKQFAYRPLEEDRFINLLDGSVRSGKTMAVLPKLLYACQYPVQGWRVIAGQSKSSIYRNQLHDLFNLVGNSRYSYNAQTGLMKLCGADWMVIGAGDEGAEKAVRGMTASVAFVDELTKVPQSFYNMLISRLSPEGARLYATTNPDTPSHWVKTDIIDNKDLHHAGDLFYMQCTMADNPNLSQSYIEKMKRQYKGAFYKRFIEGLWVTAEGAIYGDCWSDDLLYDDHELPAKCLDPENHIVALDYGTVNPLAAGEMLDDGETVWLHREFYYDSAKEQRQLTDQEYIGVFGKWLRESPIRDGTPCIIIDPSAASFRAACIGEGWWVKDADNEVIEGIKTVSSVLAQRKVRINRKCENTIREMRNYAWDDRAAKRGEEKPLKVQDHTCFVGETMVECPEGPRRLDALTVGDRVVTPLGVARVLATAERIAPCITDGMLRGTPEHPIFHCGRWMRFDTLYTCESRQKCSTESPSGDTLSQQGSQIVTITSRILGTFSEALSRCTAKFGKLPMAQFPPATTSTTGTETRETTASKIWNVCRRLSIFPDMLALDQPILSCWPGFDHSRWNGIDRKTEGNGTGSTPYRRWRKGNKCRPSSGPASNAGKITAGRGSAFLLSFAATIASRLPGVNRVWTMFPGAARFAAASLWRTSTARSDPAAAPVPAGRRTVYALRTEHGCYIANGRLVSNCDAVRYGCREIFKPWRIES